MIRHLLGVFERAIVSQVIGDVGGAEGVAAGGFGQPGGAGAGLHHHQCVVGVQWFQGELAAAIYRAEQKPLGVGAARRFEVGVEMFLRMVMHGNFQALSSLLVQAQPPALAILIIILGPEFDHGPDATKAVYHDGDEGAITEPIDRVRGDGIKQPPRLFAFEHRGLAGAGDVFRPLDGARGIAAKHLAHDEPVKQAPQGGEMLLDGLTKADRIIPSSFRKLGARLAD